MTREQAIKALRWFKEYNEEDYCGGDRIQDEHGDWYYRITEQDFEAFDVAIKALEQEPKTGHWVKYNATYFTAGKLTSVIHSIRECSECHMKIADFCGEMKYCPNCGCRMVEPQESEEE